MIEIIPFTRDHFALLKTWLNETSPAYLMKWGGVTFLYPLTDEQLESYSYGANGEECESYLFTIIETKSRRSIGHVALRKIDYTHQSARVGKLLIGNQQDRGKGYTPLILDKILSYAFDRLKLHRVTLGVFDNNPHAYRIYLKYGFTQEGYFRDFRRVGETYWGMYEMSMLESEWQNKKNSSNE
jgi:RimJ/RimL family protein N-acetyltransferase